MKHFGRWAFLLVLILARAFGASEGRDPLLKTLGPASEERSDVRIYLFPRTDLNLLVAGTPVEPGMGLENRFEFQPETKITRLRGRLLLIDVEVPKILDILSRRHWKVEGLTHILLGESPAVKSIQFVAEGPSLELAEGVRGLLSSLHMPLPVSTPQPATPEASDMDFQKQADSLLGPGEWKGRVLCLTLDAQGDTLDAGPKRKDPTVSGALYLQKTTEGVLVMGDLVVPPAEAEGLFQTFSANHLELTSWVREPARAGVVRARLRFYAKGSLEDLARDLNALRNQWKSLFSPE
jgi:hypothetical protein